MLEIGFEALNFFPRFFSYILFQNSIDSIQHIYISSAEEKKRAD